MGTAAHNASPRPITSHSSAVLAMTVLTINVGASIFTTAVPSVRTNEVKPILSIVFVTAARPAGDSKSTFRRGERWCVMGKNGAGKLTLLKMVAGAPGAVIIHQGARTSSRSGS